MRILKALPYHVDTCSFSATMSILVQVQKTNKRKMKGIEHTMGVFTLQTIWLSQRFTLMHPGALLRHLHPTA